MQEKELMIGDWVQVPSECNRYKRIMSTFDIDEAPLYRPIPLTDKILKRNGFEYFHKNYSSLSYEHPFKLKMIEWPNENGLGGLWTICDIIKIRFVHQLQRALMLCGIEKEIVM